MEGGGGGSHKQQTDVHTEMKTSNGGRPAGNVSTLGQVTASSGGCRDRRRRPAAQQWPPTSPHPSAACDAAALPATASSARPHIHPTAGPRPTRPHPLHPPPPSPPTPAHYVPEMGATALPPKVAPTPTASRRRQRRPPPGGQRSAPQGASTPSRRRGPRRRRRRPRRAAPAHRGRRRRRAPQGPPRGCPPPRRGRWRRKRRCRGAPRWGRAPWSKERRVSGALCWGVGRGGRVPGEGRCRPRTHTHLRAVLPYFPVFVTFSATFDRFPTFSRTHGV